MKANSAIVLSVCLAFLIAFTLYGTSYSLAKKVFPSDEESWKHEFFSKEISNEKKKIFILGSSQVGRLNATAINQIISEENNGYVVYNLAWPSDRPSVRIKMLDDIITKKPKIVLYGLDMRDFRINILNTNPVNNVAKDPEKVFPDPYELIKNSLNLNDYKIFYELDFFENPKLSSLQTIRKITDSFSSSPKKDFLLDNYGPFFKIRPIEFKLSSNEEKLNFQSNKDANALYRIIEHLQENEIKIVFFITPIHQYLFDNLSENDKKLFDDFIYKITNEYNVQVYSLRQNYWNMEIWSDYEHISMSHNQNYDFDISKIIIEHIDE
jgi:hypothetical protein